MVAAHKAESENEEVQEKVRARAAVTINPGEGTTELEHQITKLMATLNSAGQGNSPASTPDSPRAMGGDGQTGVFLPAPAPIMVGPVLDRLPQTAAHLQVMGQGLQSVETRGRTAKGLMLGMKEQPAGETPTLSSALDGRVRAIWLGNDPLQPQL